MTIGFGDAPPATAVLDPNSACLAYPKQSDYPTFAAYNAAATACDNAVKTCSSPASVTTGIEAGLSALVFLNQDTVSDLFSSLFGPIKPSIQTVNGVLCPSIDSIPYRIGIGLPFLVIAYGIYSLVGGKK